MRWDDVGWDDVRWDGWAVVLQVDGDLMMT
jgi:hypothetical protein